MKISTKVSDALIANECKCDKSSTNIDDYFVLIFSSFLFSLPFIIALCLSAFATSYIYTFLYELRSFYFSEHTV